MNTINRLLESLDSSGGHLVLLFLLFLIGVVMITFKLPKSEDILVGAFAALLAILRSRNSDSQ